MFNTGMIGITSFDMGARVSIPTSEFRFSLSHP